MLNEHAGELTEVGGRAFIKTRPGHSGHAVFGPYETLEPGKYKVEFYIKPLGVAADERDALCAVVDVVASLETIVETLVFRSRIAEGEIFAVYFEIAETTANVEYRVYVNGVEPLLLGDPRSAIPVEASDSSRHNPPPAFFHEHMESILGLFFSGIGIAALQETLVATVSDSQFHLRTHADFEITDELILKHNFSIMYPSPVFVAMDERASRGIETPVVVLGTCTAYGQFGFSLVGRVMDAIYGDHRRIHCVSISDLRTHWGEQKGKPVLITSEQPSTALSYLLTTSGFPILAFFDDPFEAVVSPVIWNAFSLSDAVRFCSRYFSCLAGCAGSDHVRFFDGSYYNDKLIKMVDAICTALGAETSVSLMTKVFEGLAADEGVTAGSTVQDVMLRRMDGANLSTLASKRFNAAERALIAHFVANYGPILLGRETEIEWPRELFFVGPAGENGEQEVSLLGAARHIVWGPYLHLPVGGWRAHIDFEIVDNFSGNDIEGDVWLPAAQSFVAKCRATLPVQGHFQLAMEFVNTNPNAPLEIRLRLLKGAIEGRFVLRRVVMRPLADRNDFVASATQKRLEAPQELLT